MKRCQVFWPISFPLFFLPSFSVQKSQAPSHSQTPPPPTTAPFKGCLSQEGCTHQERQTLCVTDFSTFTSQVARPFSSEWRKLSGFAWVVAGGGGADRVTVEFQIHIHPEEKS